MPLKRHYTELEYDWYERKSRILDQLYELMETDAEDSSLHTGTRAGAAIVKRAIDLLDAETIKKLEE